MSLPKQVYISDEILHILHYCGGGGEKETEIIL